jgi:non-homologous end joining protein Ku
LVLSEKKHIVAVQATAAGLLLSTLQYKYQVQKYPIISKKRVKTGHVALLKQLIESYNQKSFKSAKFKDRAVTLLKRRVQRKRTAQLRAQSEAPIYT